MSLSLGLAVGIAAPAQAADECGAGATVTCTSAGNTYPNGISYTNDNQIVTLQSGVIVDSGANVGVNLSGTGTQTLNMANGVPITTNGANGVTIFGATGLVTVSGAGNSVSTSNALAGYEIIGGAGVNATVGDVTLGGASTFGVLVQASGPASLTTGNVTINGSSAFGIDVVSLGTGANGAIAIDTSGGTVSLTGTGAQQAINAQSINGGAVTITTANVSTLSNTADAITATTNGTGVNGAVTIDSTAGTVNASGTGTARGIVATSTAGANSGLVTVKAGDVHTTGTGTHFDTTQLINVGATAITALSRSGDVSVTAGNLSTVGELALGVSAGGNNVSVTAGNITTLGDSALGVSAIGKALVSVTTKDVSTSGDNAIGILAASSLVGAAGLTTVDSTAGTITTRGANATAISISSDAVVHAGTIETMGDNSPGVSVINSGTITITSQSIVTHGSPNANLLFNNSDAIQAITGGTGAAGNIVIDASKGVGLLETFGSDSPGVRAQSSGGSIDITVGTIRTHGAGSGGVDAFIVGGSGSLTVTAKGDISAGSPDFSPLTNAVAGGITAVTQGSGDVTVITKSIATVADHASGVFAQSSGGAVTIDTRGGTISTSGDFATGVVVGSVSGTTSITTGDVHTTGTFSEAVNGHITGPNHSLTIDTTAGTLTAANSAGIDAGTSGPGPSDPPNAGPLTIRAGNINAGLGITAEAKGGNIDITVSGAINSTGSGVDASNGDFSGGHVTTTINVTGSIVASGANGHGINSIVDLGGNNVITVSGSVSATGASSTGIISGGIGDSVTIASGGSVSGETGIELQASGPATLINSGTITGTGGTAVKYLTFGANFLTFTNSGTVNGDVLMGATNDIAILNTGSVINGVLDGRGGTDTLRLAGTGSGALDLSKVVNFEVAEKNDAGAWNLTGTGTIATSTTVNAGLLSVNGQLTSSTVTVAAAGKLGGNGTIVGNVTVNGTVAPGNSIGTLNIVGAYTQATGSVYTPEVNAATADLINVTGAATIQSGTSVDVAVTPGNFTLGHRYTILTASGGVTGQFSTLTDNSPFVGFALASDADNIYLDVLRNRVSFRSVAQTRNQRAVAGALDALPTDNALVGAAAVLDVPNALRAFDRLSGEVHASLKGTLVDESRFIRDAVIGRLRQFDGGPGSVLAPRMATIEVGGDKGGRALAYGSGDGSPRADAADRVFPIKPLPSATERITAWAQGFGNWGHSAGDGNAAALNRSTGGFVSGIDATSINLAGDMWRFGFAGGYQRTSVDIADRASSARVDTYHLAAYAGTQLGAFGLRAGSAYSRHDVVTNRSINFPGFADVAHAAYGAHTAQVFGEAGYTVTFNDVAVEPFAALAHVNVGTDGFTETGGPAALSVLGGAIDTTFSTIGLRIATPLQWLGAAGLIVRASAGWKHAFGTVLPTADMAFAATGTPFVIAGVPIARDLAVVEAGLDGHLTANTTLRIGYTGQLASKAQDHEISANFTWQF